MALSTEAGHPPGRAGRVVRLLRRAGVDRAVGFTVLGRGWSALSGLVTLGVMTRFLSLTQQGYYVTFGSVLALAVFFELGLALVLVQFASHERASLEWTEAGLLDGNTEARKRLSALLAMSLKWYGGVAALLVAAVLPLGLIFFGSHGDPGVVWQIPWVWIVVVTGLTIALTPALAILEGCGLIAEIARLQVWQNMAGSVLLWLALFAHWGLYAAPITNTVSLVCLAVWLGTKKRAFFADLLRRSPAETPLDWRGEVWPLQWKIALSCVSGYLIFQLFNPILFAARGPAAAGRMGLTLAVMGAVSSVSIAWVATKAATFGTLVARADYAGLDRLFFGCLWRSWGLVAAGSFAVWLIGWGLHLEHAALSLRVLPPLPLGLLALTTVCNHGVFAEAMYLRAHKQEPFLVTSLVMATLVALSSLLLVRPFGATGMMAGYFALSAGNLAVATRIFRQKRREWHRTDAI